VTFLNIANIHAMRESIEGVRNLTLLTNSDNWMARVEETKWLQHVRLVLSAALRIADTIANKKMTVLVHCSDGWDRTGQLCALSQILLDDHYRTLKGFLEIIEKEWIRVGHKFQDRVGPGNPESKFATFALYIHIQFLVADIFIRFIILVAEEQSPIFLQFLDCVWQILRLYPTYFEFNAKLLEFIADSLFSARFGTFLGNCDRERNLWDTATRTPSLWTFILSNISNYSNPFYRKPKNGLSLIPPSSSILRQVTLWTEYYFRGASLLSFPHGNPEPPEEGATGNIELSRTCFDDMSDSLSAAKKQIAQLEEQLRLRGSHCDQPVHQSVHQPVHIPTPAPIPSQVPPVLSVPTPTAVHVLPPSASLHVPSTITPTAGSNWTCGICSKLNLSAATKCVVCGRGPSSSTLK
jgi:hypothetical protein